jgi:hypothetical protein
VDTTVTVFAEPSRSQSERPDDDRRAFMVMNKDLSGVNRDLMLFGIARRRRK